MPRLPRPNFATGQLLTSASLNAAQLYQIDIGREHRATAHLPGVVQGLKVKTDASGLQIEPGYAVDAFGRDLVLQQGVDLTREFNQQRSSNPTADTFELLLNYDQRFSQGADGNEDDTAIDETPRAEIRPYPGPAIALPPYDSTQPAPDVPNALRPVRIAMLKADPDKSGDWNAVQDGINRQEAGVVASAIVPGAADSANRVELSRQHFAVFLDSGIKDDTAPRLRVDAQGAELRGLLTVEGDIAAGGAISFPAAGPAPKPEDGYGLFRIGEASAAPDTHELRLVIPPQGSLVIGAWNQQSGNFEALLTVDAASRSVTVAGDLIIGGATIDQQGKPPGNSGSGASTPTPAAADEKKTGDGTNSVSAWLKSAAGSAARLVLLLAILFALIRWNAVPSGVIPCESLDSIRGFLGWQKFCQR